MFELQNFDVAAFQKKFNLDVRKLAGAEKITKELLRGLSRDVLTQLHTNEDIRPTNAVLRALTPLNQKVWIEFMKAFSGFKFDAANVSFTEKNKGTYGKARVASEEFLEDEGNNIWTWAAENVEVKAKEFTLDAVKKGMENFLKKADKNGFSRDDVLMAAISAGFTQADLIAAMGKLAQLAEQAPADAANAEQAQAAA